MMATEEEPPRRRSAMALRGLAFLALVLLVTALTVSQLGGSGAYLAEFSARDPDEARHFVAGLMVADYARAGLPSPGAFAELYRLHVPPAPDPAHLSLFHLVSGGWMLVLTPATPAVLLLPALLAALLVVCAAWATARATGPLPAVAVGAVLAVLPLLREAALVVGLELPLALLALLAALGLARILRRERGVLAFALPAGAAVLTAPAGAALLLLPPLAALMGGRGDLLRRPMLVALAVLGLLALAVNGAAGARPVPDLPGLLAAGQTLRASLGLLLTVCAGAGFLFAIWSGWRGEPDGRAMVPVAALLPAAACALALGAGRGAPMDALVLLAPAVMLAGFGALRLIGLVTSGWTLLSGLLVALLFLLAAMPALLEPVRKRAIGMDGAAEAFLARDAAAVVVIAAQPPGDAAFAAAVAQRDRTGRSFVVPATAGDAAGFAALLDETGATALAVETRPGAHPPASSAAALAALAATPERFSLIGTFPRADGQGEVSLYAVRAAPGAPQDPAAAIRRRALRPGA